MVSNTTLELINVTSLSRNVSISIPPSTRYFSVGLGRFPSKGGIVAPGMSVKYTVSFTPDSLGDYKDFIQVKTRAESVLVVPIEAWRPPPKLTLSRVLDCGFCLVGGKKCVEFSCQNVGLSSESFYIFPKSLWPVSDLRSVVGTNSTEQPPFAVTPSLFVLQPGEATVVQALFYIYTVSIKGEGQVISLELVSVSGEKGPPVLGEVRDNAAQHLVRFSPCNPHSVQHKSLVIRNNINVEMPFKWEIMKPDLDHLLPEETPKSAHIQSHPDTDDVVHISPLTGVLAPCQVQEFCISFSPKELKDYCCVSHLVVRDVPQLPPEPSEHSVSQPGPKVSDVIVMKVKVQGRTEPYQILLEPHAVLMPGDILIHTTTCRLFKMLNYSKTFILFQWETLNRSGHVIEVKPSAGRIEENSIFEFKLVVTGGKPEKIVTSLICNIQHHHKPITLPVEVSFKTTSCDGSDSPVDNCFLDVFTSHLRVRADVQSPQACLFNCRLVLSELYLGVPTTAGVTLFNQTLLPSHFSWMDVEEENVISEDDLREEKTSLHPSAVKKNLVSVHIRPHVGNLSDEPYCITPRQTVIPGKSTATVCASFTPVTLSGTACESTCVGQALGFRRLECQTRAYVPGKVRRVQGLDLEPIRLDLQAAVSPAVLLVQMEEDDGVLQFTASAGDLLKAESDKEVSVCEFDVKQRFQLKSPLKMPLRFRLETEPLFSVFKSLSQARTSISSSTPTDDSDYPLVLQPEEWIRVKVAFHCSLPLVDTVDQQGEELLPTVMLIHSASGQKKLRFEQNLQITFSNNTQQTVPLRAHLYLPTLSLSCDSLSFGFCYVGQTQTKDVNLNIAGGHIYWKSLIESGEGESDVFRATPDFGLLKSNKPYATVCSQSLQLSFTPSEDREFKAVMVITSPLGKIPVTLQLQGTGSLDEVHVRVTPQSPHVL
ncbi:deleted in lung and esophageal cancer protein 1-like [Cololabis saira]|uniref:deleted in lung and esophageal cancer protein 1-like n=1 Tax=Cololabis saira TaxID=129043 RepID=UPI002AD54C21|nr:deleted in lung and esophageal cancer protein 1-like [Cololabis saira]